MAKKIDFKNNHHLCECVFLNCEEGIALLDSDLKIMAFNPALERMTGYKNKEVLGKECREILGHCKIKYFCDSCPSKKVLSGEKNISYKEILMETKNKGRIWTGLSVAKAKDKEGRIVGIILGIRDISRKKEIDQVKTEFISLASHELRTPLAAMKGFLSMLLRGDVGKMQGRQLHFLNRVYQSNERMVKLVEDLLDVSRIEAGKIILNPEPIDIQKTLNEVLNELSIKGLEKQITICLDKKKNVDLPKVLADKERLHQIFFNLIDNAIKYSFFRGNILISFKKKNSFIITSVKDKGVGISPEQWEKIFEKFGRVHNPLSIKVGGTGLGLFITKNLIESQGGKIWVESKLDKGTNFSFSIPVAKQLSLLKDK